MPLYKLVYELMISHILAFSDIAIVETCINCHMCDGTSNSCLHNGADIQLENSKSEPVTIGAADSKETNHVNKSLSRSCERLL